MKLKSRKKAIKKTVFTLFQDAYIFSCVKNKCVFRAVLFHSTMR